MSNDSDSSVLISIINYLDQHDLAYQHLVHEPTRTSKLAAEARGEPMSIGGKALLMKVGDQFSLIVMSAALKLNSNALRHQFGVDKCRFATVDELKVLTGLVPGSIPPFGEPILPFPLYVDQSTLENDRIAFNAGSLTDSIIMSVEDYRRIAKIEKIIGISATC